MEQVGDKRGLNGLVLCSTFFARFNDLHLMTQNEAEDEIILSQESD